VWVKNFSSVASLIPGAPFAAVQLMDSPDLRDTRPGRRDRSHPHLGFDRSRHRRDQSHPRCGNVAHRPLAGRASMRRWRRPLARRLTLMRKAQAGSLARLALTSATAQASRTPARLDAAMAQATRTPARLDAGRSRPLTPRCGFRFAVYSLEVTMRSSVI
jgi:hypothetical protein